MIAIFEERDFLDTKNNITKNFSDLAPKDQKWILEMAKDLYQEITKKSADETRLWVEANNNSSGHELMWRFVKDNRETYWANTGCETNWAG